MSMTETIKVIVKNYLDNASLSTYVIGTVTDNGVRISDKMLLPMVMIVGNLKKNIVAGDKVRLLKKQGGREYFVLEVMRDDA